MGQHIKQTQTHNRNTNEQNTTTHEHVKTNYDTRKVLAGPPPSWISRKGPNKKRLPDT